MKRYKKSSDEIVEVSTDGRRVIATAHAGLADAVEDALDFSHAVNLEKMRVDMLTFLLDKSAEGAYRS